MSDPVPEEAVALVQVVRVAQLLARPQAESVPAVLWSANNQLHTNLVTLPRGGTIGRHTEDDLDVTLTVLAGSAAVWYRTGDTERTVEVDAPSVVVLPAGTSRAVTAGERGVTYLSAHRARPGLMPRLRTPAS